MAWAKFLGYEVTEEGNNQAVPLEQLDLTATRDQEVPLPIVQDVRLPKGFTYCHAKPKSIYTELIAEMAERKHLTIEELMEFKVGFTKDDPKWEPYAIFPVIEHGRVVYWQGRTYVDVPGESTKRFPNRTECPNSSKFWIYNIDELRSTRAEIAMAMESILNVLSMRRLLYELNITNVTPICIFKHYLSKPQARKLLEIPSLKEICLLYDHDATRSSWEKSPMLSARITITVAEMPPGPGGEKNDPNDDPGAAWTAFEQREVSTAISALRYKTVIERRRQEGPKKPIERAIPQHPLDNLNL